MGHDGPRGLFSILYFPSFAKLRIPGSSSPPTSLPAPAVVYCSSASSQNYFLHSTEYEFIKYVCTQVVILHLIYKSSLSFKAATRRQNSGYSFYNDIQRNYKPRLAPHFPNFIHPYVVIRNWMHVHPLLSSILQDSFVSTQQDRSSLRFISGHELKV